jgi:Fe-S cluster assembly protein SufD
VIEEVELNSPLLQSAESMTSPQALSDLNHQGLETTAKLGIPSRKHEEWKYTSIDSLSPLNFSAGLKSADKPQFEIPSGTGNSIRIIVRNGFFDAELSSKLLSESGITVTSLVNGTPVFEPGTVALMDEEHFVALNSALCRDAIAIRIAANAKPELSVEILHISEGKGTMSSPRLFVLAEKGSEATITESFISANSNDRTWTNAVSEIRVEENAVLRFVKVQTENGNSIQTDFTKAVQDANSTFDIVTVSLGGKLIRNNLHIRHAGTNCTSHLFGLFAADGDQLIDNHTLVDHAMPHCYSNELYKGIVGGKATGVFNGKIFVRKDAQKTNAYQSNKTILLTDDAQMNAKPQLEIFADDVKCTHGATTGQLDDEALFYLRARGIGEQTARTLLNIAFAQDVLNNIANENLREKLTSQVTEKLQRSNA